MAREIGSDLGTAVTSTGTHKIYGFNSRIYLEAITFTVPPECNTWERVKLRCGHKFWKYCFLINKLKKLERPNRMPFAELQFSTAGATLEYTTQ